MSSYVQTRLNSDVVSYCSYSAYQKNSFFSSTLYKITCSSYDIKDT